MQYFFLIARFDRAIRNFKIHMFRTCSTMTETTRLILVAIDPRCDSFLLWGEHALSQSENRKLETSKVLEKIQSGCRSTHGCVMSTYMVIQHPY